MDGSRYVHLVKTSDRIAYERGVSNCRGLAADCRRGLGSEGEGVQAGRQVASEEGVLNDGAIDCGKCSIRGIAGVQRGQIVAGSGEGRGTGRAGGAGG